MPGRPWPGWCDRCEAEVRARAKFVAVRPDGVRRTLMVCRFCYLHLMAARRRTAAPGGKR